MPLYNWSEVEKERMNPLLLRQVIHCESMTVARIQMSKGCLVPMHSHHNEQVSMVERGALKFVLDGQEQILKAGDTLLIPPHVPHSAEAMEDSVAVDLFSPRREDWIRGDDAYMRK
jgi:quercetin dioxygenase-like cupin family protein